MIPRAAFSTIGPYSAPTRTALVYDGLGLVPRLLAGLDALLARDGFATVAEAVGSGRGEWLRA